MSRTLLSSLIVLFATLSAFAEMGVPIQLKLKSPSGTYPTEAGLSFKLLVLSPTTNCILREENFSAQSVVNGSISLVLGNGARGVNDPSLTLNQVYDNSKSKSGLSCVDANNNVVSVGQVYNPAVGDQRTIRVTTTLSGDPILVNFTMRATPFAIQAESVGGKPASDIIVNDAASQMNQTNLNDLLLDVGRFNNLKNLAVSGQAVSATSAVNFTGTLVGDVSGTQGSTSVDRIKGVPVSATAPSNNQVLQFNGTQYVPVTLPTSLVTSVAGRTGAVVLSSSDISGLTFGTAANTFAQGNDSRITGALQSSTVFSGDVSGTSSTISVNRVGGKTSAEIAASVNDTQAATSANMVSTIVKRDGSGNISASSVSATNNSTQNVYVYEATNTNSVRIKAPTSFSNYALTLPVDAGTNGQVLQTDGSGNLSWINPSTGSVTAVSASAPLASSGGTTPNITIAQANASASGYLSSADWTTFNNKQAALGYVPLNAASNLSDVASAATARTNLGLGGAAVLNVGTSAGTVAAGDDARITGALQSSAFNAYVASASCSTSQTMYWNSVSSQFECQAINFPADAVTSVAGRTGAVVLSSSDISGLGNSASRNVGTSAGTVAAGDDSRITGALQSSSIFSGDISGTVSSINVNKIRGVPVSATAPTTNQVLQYDGSQYVPVAIPSAPVSSVAGRTGAVVLSSSDISGLTFGTAANTFAQGNDSRITGALQSSSIFSGDISGTVSAINVNKIRGVVVSATAPTNNQVLQYNGTQYVPATLPSAPVTTVAGRTGAIVLSSSDISGLGDAAALNVGTSAGTVAAGDDARIVNAVQTSSAHSGDVSGTLTNLSVNRIRGIAVSATAPTTNQVLQYDGSQYVPVAIPSAPVSSVAGRTGAVVLASSDISGLSFGTAANTFAQGNDSRITGALQSSAFNGYVASASCSTSQTMYWNSVSSQFECQAINFPASAVTSVAGRTGAVVLSSSDISGLSFGTAANTFAQGNDSRIVNAVQTSSAHSGDVSGTLTTLSVNRIRGIPVSATAPTTNQVLQYDGSQYVPVAIPSAPVSSVAGRTGAVVLSSSDISGLGAAAALNVGTSAGTVAAGNDSRITNAFQISSTALSGDISGTSSTVSVNRIRGVPVSATAPTTNQVLQYDGSQYVPVAIPSAPVSSVAGRTGAVVLSSSDISGLSFGTAANTFAQGNDSRITNAFQISSTALSGDISGTSTTVSVNRIRGVAVSATAPTSNQVLQYNGTQYVPVTLPSAPVTTVAGRTGAVVLSSSDISGLGAAAALNVGTSAGTVAAGDDSRITGALQLSAFNGYIASAGCSTSQSMYWNSVSSQFMCQAINFPADAVTSVAGRTGAVVLSSSDISGLGAAAALNVGTSAGTVAAGNDSRIVNAVQTSSAHSGDVSGTLTALSVDRIKGIPVSATAPTSNQVLQYNGTQYVPVTLPTAPVTTVAGRTGAVVLSSSDISGLSFGTAANTFAQGNDSRIVNAVQTSSAHSGDVSGTLTALSVDRIKGVPVSATAPTSNQVLQYNGTQYVPVTLPTAPVTTVAGRTGAVVLSSSDISGLTFGTAANTFAQGNDSRITGALQGSSAFSGDVSGTSTTISVNRVRGVAVSATAPTTNQVLQYDGSQYVPVTLPSAPVTTVAGRTGAVVLSSSDISGLSFGTAANTFAQGNDSRIVNAVQTSSAHSGDVSGTLTALSVDRIKGIAVSATAPTSNQVLQYNGTQYVPVTLPSAPVTTVAGRTGAVVLASSDISGLSFGTAANTFAQGNDSRITGALQLTAFNGYVASASCTTSQSLYWNSVSSQFLCQAIAFPADAVSSVAGRTGAVVLSSSDVSGLGNVVSRNIGTTAGTAAAGDDSRIVNAFQISSTALSGDISGTSTTVSVDKIKGRNISSTAPTTGQALVWNGTQWVPTSGFPKFIKSAADQTFTTATLANVTSLGFPVVAGVTYKYKFHVLYTSGGTTNGLKIGITYPAVTMSSALANIPGSTTDGTGFLYSGFISTSGDSVMSANSPAVAPTIIMANVEGIIIPSAAGTVQLQGATEAVANIVIKAGSFVEVVEVP